MANGRHSYIAFYPSDWTGGTAHMGWTMKAVYHAICCYTWDKVEPMPAARLRVMLMTLPDGHEIVDALVDEGALVRDSTGAVHSPRALEEAEKALDLWERKSAGGRARRGTGKRDGREQEDSSTEPEPEPEPDSLPDGKEGSPSETRQSVVDAWNEMAGQNDLAQVRQMTDARTKSLKARIKEHGAETLVEHIARIPQYPFLLGKSETGWKANFDWLLQPSSCTKLIEGAYARGKGKGSAWTA
jgi:hypothetical protein